jgi:hypothetical protein
MCASLLNHRGAARFASAQLASMMMALMGNAKVSNKNNLY